jgi:NAD-dependent SIR2 family protein deacetylase
MMILDPDFWDFFLEGGDELMNTEQCPHCGGVIYLDQPIEWIDQAKQIAKCPHCGKEVKID